MRTTIKIFAMALICVFATTIQSCKKPEKGEAGPQGPVGASGPEATTKTYILTFNTTQNWQSYSGFVGLYDTDDIIVTYIFNATYSEDYYVQLPYILNGAANIFAEVGENTGHIYINTNNANGSAGSPWASSVSLKFKSVLIKSRAMKSHPKLNLKDYNEVKRAFNLKD